MLNIIKHISQAPKLHPTNNMSPNFKMVNRKHRGLLCLCTGKQIEPLIDYKNDCGQVKTNQSLEKNILHHVKSLFDSISEYLSVNKFFVF